LTILNVLKQSLKTASTRYSSSVTGALYVVLREHRVNVTAVYTQSSSVAHVMMLSSHTNSSACRPAESTRRAKVSAPRRAVIVAFKGDDKKDPSLEKQARKTLDKVGLKPLQQLQGLLVGWLGCVNLQSAMLHIEPCLFHKRSAKTMQQLRAPVSKPASVHCRL
jgi:hypothetical protein